MSLILAISFIIISLYKSKKNNIICKSNDLVDDFVLMDDLEGR